jgi:hypothetical protein
MMLLRELSNALGQTQNKGHIAAVAIATGTKTLMPMCTYHFGLLQVSDPRMQCVGLDDFSGFVGIPGGMVLPAPVVSLGGASASPHARARKIFSAYQAIFRM